MEILGKTKWRDQLRNFAEELLERRSLAIEIHKNKIPPCVDANGNQTIVGALEITHAFKLHHAFEDAIVSIRPTVIRTTKLLGTSALLRHYSCGVVAANVVESTELLIITADHNEWLFVDIDGEELAGFAKLVEAPDYLPIRPKDAGTLELRDARIEIPRRRNREGAFQRCERIVEIQDIADAAIMHKWDSGKTGETYI